ncbi:pyridoxal phosphate-dependent decarboxylase family protein [Aneurinibacillus uraniidurans]|uniref:pyridoxal phosphate-dependent decarboxylase family protein n=1 Tax=Aneurinibacillus uraniidurans TaxID=2966586 RepID=UPI002349ABBE|nr:pyridoxal-dependent decarboxylase [Aneurinibacillus sp. B1]WCN36747.1 pyridoxal-dependent decarboxylase [Aneurinibacillus sp. B1]
MNQTLKDIAQDTRLKEIFLRNLSCTSAPSQIGSDTGDDEIAGWFLGTRGENAELLQAFIHEAIDAVVQGRKNFHPEDPAYITEERQASPGYRSAVQSLQNNFSRMAAFLNEYALPFYSMRYQGHMIWDVTLPALVGYFTTMLQNPNNVTIQASTATTFFEIMVGADLCSMIGFETKNSPWAHLTSGGTVANMESMWAAREMKFLPPVIKTALQNEISFAPAMNITVTQPNGTKVRLLDLDNWQLLNLTYDEVLAIPARMAELICPGKSAEDKQKMEQTIWTTLTCQYSLNTIGIAEYARTYLSGIQFPAVAVPSTKHYSWVKSAAILGFGRGGNTVDFQVLNRGIINIPVTPEARMDTAYLRKALDQCVQHKIPVVMVVAVFGSTEESAVDPVLDILTIRDEYRRRHNLDFSIHVDAAWGGYLLSAIRKDFAQEWPFDKAVNVIDDDPFISDTTNVPLSPYVIEQARHIRFCDSVTIDPHKWGYIPYPAGSLSYRNGKTINLITFDAPYIGTGDAMSSIGEAAIEGSKPGAAASAVFLSHSVIRPSETGYGKLINRSLINAKLFYLYLHIMAKQNDPFFVIPLAELPDTTSTNTSSLAFLQDRFVNMSYQDILTNEELRSYFHRIGPDQNIVAYAFNYYLPDGTPNTDITRINQFNQMIYERLYPEAHEKIQDFNLMVTITTFNRTDYYDSFMNAFARRLQAAHPEDVLSINCLRSVIMDPWLSDTYQGEQHLNFFQAVIIPVLRETVIQCAHEMRAI